VKRQVIGTFLWLMFLTGFIYPLFITGLAQIIWKESANGSFVAFKDKVVGSKLIAQNFQSERYFWPRPSAVNFNPLPSGGSNLGPISADLKKLVKERTDHLLKANGLKEPSKVPRELLYASGSGLDPEISLKAVLFQFNRVVQARNLKTEQREKLLFIIKKMSRRFNFLANPRVNVLELNIVLDELEKS
jgi:potassium-transporting ATPase KdpC subunit